MLISCLSFSPWLAIIFTAKNGGLCLPENAVRIMQLVLLMCAYCKAKLKTEDLGFDLCEFPHGETSLNYVFTLGILMCAISISQGPKAIA